jgi:hypothetical protein
MGGCRSMPQPPILHYRMQSRTSGSFQKELSASLFSHSFGSIVPSLMTMVTPYPESSQDKVIKRILPSGILNHYIPFSSILQGYLKPFLKPGIIFMPSG